MSEKHAVAVLSCQDVGVVYYCIMTWWKPTNPVVLPQDGIMACLLAFPASVQFSCSVLFNSLQPHGLQHTAHQASLSITNSWSLLKFMSIESVMPSNHLILIIPFSCLQYFPTSGSFPMSQFFTSGGQNIRASASASGLLNADFL